MAVALLIKNKLETQVDVEAGRFPDGTRHFKVNIDPDAIDESSLFIVEWRYNDDSELNDVMMLTMYLRDKYTNEIALRLPYIPNARMDRVYNDNEVFTLKYFAQIINMMEFKYVETLDAHSHVSEELIDRHVKMDVRLYLNQAIGKSKPDCVFMPDAGAHVRYSDKVSLPSTYGVKDRDWETGKILGYSAHNPELVKGKHVLIIDDISSRGGTFYHAAITLLNSDAKSVDLYVTHCEETIKLGELLKETSPVNTIYTANPLFDADELHSQAFKNVNLI